MTYLNFQDEAATVDEATLLPFGEVPLLESLYPVNSTEKEKAAYVAGLLRVALQSEDEL